MLSRDKIMETVKSRFTGKLDASGNIPGQRINLVVDAIVGEVNRELAEIRQLIPARTEDAVDAKPKPEIEIDASGFLQASGK